MRFPHTSKVEPNPDLCPLPGDGTSGLSRPGGGSRFPGVVAGLQGTCRGRRALPAHSDNAWETRHSPCLGLSPRLQVYGDKDADGFYRGETCARLGLIPCNMVSEIQADDEEMMDQLLRQGFLPLNTPVEKIGKRPPPGRPCPCWRGCSGLLWPPWPPLPPPATPPAGSRRRCGQGPVCAIARESENEPALQTGL